MTDIIYRGWHLYPYRVGLHGAWTARARGFSDEDDIQSIAFGGKGAKEFTLNYLKVLIDKREDKPK